MSGDVSDIPSDHSFFDSAYVRSWLETTTVNHPQRPAMFDQFVAEISAANIQRLTVLELGSGPGVLAEQILSRCSVHRYWLVDFSPQMHELAQERLGLGLPVHEVRLHIHPFKGSGDGLCGSDQRAKEPITVTHTEIIYRRRLAVLAHAQRTKNVAETCRVFGISRTRYYEWKNRADRYGLDALMPKERRSPQMPSATPTHVVERLLTLAVLEPTIGCRQYADRLGDQGFVIAKSTVQKHLVDHALGTRAKRLARAAAIIAATTGLVTEAARDDEPFGFCLASAGPGELVCLDSFYIGNLKGVGKVYQLSAIDVFTRFAFVAIVVGTPDAAVSMRFLDRLLRHYRRHGVRSAPCSATTVLSTTPAPSALPWRPRGCVTCASRPARPTTTPWWSASTARSSKSAGARPSTAVTSPRSASSRPKPTHGSLPTTAADATTATTCVAGPLKRSSTTTSEQRQHDDHQPQRPSVTSTPGPEGLGDDDRATYVQADFKSPSWTEAISERIEVVVTMQALHELRHSSRSHLLHHQLASVAEPGGLLLICDHLRPPDDERPLYMSVDEHLSALELGGMINPSLVLTLNQLGLFRGTFPG